MKATFELTQEQVTSALNNGGLNFTLNGEVIQPIYECEKILYLDVEKQPTKILITEDNIKDVKEGDTVMWERFADGWCKTMTMNKYIVDGCKGDYITFSASPIASWSCYSYSRGAICYKIIK